MNVAARGRTRTRNNTPAHASPGHAAPSTPMWSMGPMAIARPSCTHGIEAIAIKHPVRAWFAHPCIGRHPGRSRPRDFYGHAVRDLRTVVSAGLD